MIVRALVPVFVTSIPILSNIHFFDLQLKSLLYKRNNQLVPLDTRVETTIEKVFDDLKRLKFKTEKQWEREKGYFKFYKINFDNVTTTGSMWLHECRLGLPCYLSFTQLNQAIDFLEFTGLFLDWNSPLGSKIAHTYVLSDKAQQFAIAQGLCSLWHKKADTLNLIANGFLSGIFAACYRPSLPTGSKLSIIATLVLGVFAIASFVNSTRLTESIEEASSINENYLDGSIEFYDKILKRNELLSSASGNKSNSKLKEEFKILESLRQLKEKENNKSS